MSFFAGTHWISPLLAAAAVFLFVAGVRAMRLGSRTIYFRHRRQRLLAGWWMVGASLLMAGGAVLAFRIQTSSFAAVPALVTSPTSTALPLAFTPTPRRIPSATLTPTPTVPPSVTPTATPRLPLSLEIMVVSSVTPQASASIGEIRFSESLNGGYPIGNRTEWQNPLARMYASFAYAHMTYGSQFTALWFRNGEIVFIDSGPWKLGGRGRTASKWEPAPHEWHPGEYEVQFYVGTEWKATGRFTLTGSPPAPTITFTSSPTRTSSPVPSKTPTPTPKPASTP